MLAAAGTPGCAAGGALDVAGSYVTKRPMASPPTAASAATDHIVHRRAIAADGNHAPALQTVPEHEVDAVREIRRTLDPSRCTAPKYRRTTRVGGGDNEDGSGARAPVGAAGTGAERQGSRPSASCSDLARGRARAARRARRRG